jgi:hypothetical protein
VLFRADTAIDDDECMMTVTTRAVDPAATYVDELAYVRHELGRLVRSRCQWALADARRYVQLTERERKLLSLALK